jgi:hypothetical protein
MRLQTYRDESRSRHFDLIFGGERPWSIDLVLVAILGMLVVVFACTVMVPSHRRSPVDPVGPLKDVN